jgi:signal peptidase I
MAANEEDRAPEKKPWAGRAAILLAVLVLFASVPVVLRLFVVEAFKIPSGSMMPTLLVGDHMFVNKQARTPARGEVIVFRYPEEERQAFVKRVVAVGGDKVTMRGGFPVVNGIEVKHCRAGTWTYKDAPPYDESEHSGELHVEWSDAGAYLVFLDAMALAADDGTTWSVPAGNVFVLGDNRNNAHDSRRWFAGVGGTVKPDLVIGRASLIWLAADPNRLATSVAEMPKLSSFDAATVAGIDACLRGRGR